MAEWELPKIQVYRLSRSAFVQTGAGVNSTDIALIRQALLEAIRQDLTGAIPAVPPQEIARRQKAVELEWLRLLKTSMPEDKATPELAELNDTGRDYSYEFYWLAQRYAASLAHTPVTYNVAFTRQLLRKVVRPWSRWLPLSHVFRNVLAELQPMTVVPIDIYHYGFRTIMTRWNSIPALRQMSVDNEAIYLQDTQQFVTTVLRNIPGGVGHEQAFLVEPEQEEVFEWTVAWHEDNRSQANVGLQLGIALSILLAIFFVGVSAPAFLYSLILVPAVAGLLWKMVLRMRQYAGQQEYAQQEIFQRTGDQVNTLENLHQIDRELNRALGLERVLSLWQDWAIRMTHAKAGGIALVDARRGRLQLVSTFGYSSDRVASNFSASRAISMSKGIAGRAARTGNTFYVEDVRTSSDYILISDTTRSQLCVPILHGEKVIAVLSLEKNDVDGFSKEERVRIARLCQRAAPAVTNALLLRETEEERQKLGSILTNITDAVIVTDQKGRLIRVNRAAVEIFNLSAEQTFTSREFVDMFRDPLLIKLFREGISSGKSIEAEAKIGRKTFRASMTPVPSVGYLLVLYDITLFKELDNLKNDLIATVSHDLKNPLTVIRGYLELIHMSETLSNRSVGYLERARVTIRDMTDLIEGLLSVARIETGLKPNLSPVALTPILQDVVEKYRYQLDEKTMALEIAIPDQIPQVLADVERLPQIVGNLLSNAIKYTPPNGRVSISAAATHEKVTISVQDSGIGIPQDALNSLFEKFNRVRDEKANGIDGTGLGLYIVKKLVEAQGGAIWVESTYGTGSTFTFTLALAPDAA